MWMNKINGVTVGADLLAFRGLHNTPLILFIHIIGLASFQINPHIVFNRILAPLRGIIPFRIHQRHLLHVMQLMQTVQFLPEKTIVPLHSTQTCAQTQRM
jgi:hypothetical protein